jgi:hypothetical protein
LHSSRRNPFTQDRSYEAEQCVGVPPEDQSHQRAISSAVERALHTGEVTGSIPVSRTISDYCACVFKCLTPHDPDRLCNPLGGVPLPGSRRESRARVIPPMTKHELGRLWNRIDVRGEDECWPWTGGAGASGHGRFLLNDGYLYSPYRLVCHLYVGSLNGGDGYHGKVVMHLCDNPCCCNPKHLRVGSQKENAKDMAAKGRGSRVTKKRTP